jgi:hypothetical protein
MLRQAVLITFVGVTLGVQNKQDHDIGDAVAYTKHSVSHPYSPNGCVFSLLSRCPSMRSRRAKIAAAYGS